MLRVRLGLGRALLEMRRSWVERAAPGERLDLGAPVIAGFLVAAVAIVVSLYIRFTGDPWIAMLATGIMVASSFFFVGVASHVVGLVGNSNNPVSGMTISAVLMTGALLWLFGYAGMPGMVATLGVAAIVCCAACTAGDVCNDLKTGALVGATPRRQQRMQLAGVAVAALVMAPVMQLLHDAYGIGTRELAAPQASLFASLARGLFGGESLPWGLIVLGTGIGLGVLVLDTALARRGSAFRLHLMPIAVGLYLPFGLAVPIFVGGAIEGWQRRRSGRSRGTLARVDRGVLFASGVVAGEALIGVGIALAIGLGLEVFEPGLAWREALTLGAALLIVLLFSRAVRSDATSRG